MKNEILKILKRGGYISGEEIAAGLKVSRTAVWKNIKRLREDGYKIDSVTNRGYCLVDDGDLLTAEAVGYEPLVYYDQIGSTNDEAKRLAEGGCSSGTLVSCNVQTGGRGRLGRSWGADNKSLCFSVVLRPNISPVKASALTLMAGLAVTRAINSVCGLSAGIKWPNDVICEGKKLCGILTELSAEMEKINYVVIGIGINVNNESFDGFDEQVRQKAGSLLMLSGKRQSRAKILNKVINELMRLYTVFEKSGFGAIKDEYNALCINVGKGAKTVGGEQISGICEGIDENGLLIIRTDDDRIKTVLSGEVSLRTSDGSYI